MQTTTEFGFSGKITSFLAALLRHIRAQFEFGDLLFYLYLIVFIRQYAWPIKSNVFAWTLTALLSLLVWPLVMLTKDAAREKVPRSFWLLVALPLFIIYALRDVFPDVSFDVLSYHLFFAERALRGALYIPGDFFPALFPTFNPAPDMITGISRHALGYRLGTIINYLCLLWTGAILNKIFRVVITHEWRRSLSILFVLLAEQMLFEINNYMVDLLALPLLLETTFLAVRLVATKYATRDLFRFVLLCGMCLGLKLTNIALVIPLFAIYAATLIFKLTRVQLKTLALRTLPVAGLIFLAPLLPFTIYLYLRTGSPVFPLYNKIFASPYWALQNAFDGRWGPKDFWEVLVWPLIVVVKPERLSELGVYSGRISLGFLAALLVLCLPREQPPPQQHHHLALRTLSLIYLAGAWLWSLSNGYSRYGMYLELLGGVMVVYTLAFLCRKPSRGDGIGAWRSARRALALALGILAIAQSLAALFFVSKYEWSQRPTLLTATRAYIEESRYLMRDYSLVKFLSPGERNRFDPVEAWVEASAETNAVMILIKDEAPVITYIENFYQTPAAQQLFKQSVQQSAGKRMFSLCLDGDLDVALNSLRRRGFTIGETNHISLPYFSRSVRLNFTLIEVFPPSGN